MSEASGKSGHLKCDKLSKKEVLEVIKKSNISFEDLQKGSAPNTREKTHGELSGKDSSDSSLSDSSSSSSSSEGTVSANGRAANSG